MSSDRSALLVCAACAWVCVLPGQAWGQDRPPAGVAAVTSLGWADLAAAHAVVRARLQVDAGAVRRAQAQPSGSVEVGLQVQDSLKGPLKVGSRVAVHGFVGLRDSPVGPGGDWLLAANGRSVVVTLIRQPSVWSLGPAVLAEPGTLAATRQALSEQERLLRAYTQPKAADPLEERVAACVQRLASAEAQAAMDDLVALGSEAVAPLVGHLSDRRPLGVRELTFANPPGAFEPRRRYAPPLVFDAVCAALNAITGYSFGFVYNGADEAARRHALAGWRLYVLETRAGADEGR